MNKNQPAFPSPGVILNGNQQGAYEGMTLRDYFAAKAMEALIPLVKRPSETEKVPTAAYAMADLMLKAREV